MINIRNITKVMLMAMFICFCSSEYSFAALGFMPGQGQGTVDRLGQQGRISTVSGTNGTSPGYTISAPKTPSAPTGNNTQQNASFCGGDAGAFAELVMTGQKIFYRLRDLIYVVAGFGIIAVSVGAFFGTLNWKWLGAIVISLLVIASAGELLVLLTGCEQYGTELIRDTLSAPTPSSSAK